MVHEFDKSPEGVKEYQKLDLTYPNSLPDEFYEKWLSETSAEDLAKYSHHTEKEVNNILRKKVGDKEYLVYSFVHYRLDPALNVTHRSRSGIGKYPIPRGHYHIEYGAYGKHSRVMDSVEAVDTGYSIPFSTENLDKIRDIGLQSEGNVSYGVDTGVIKITVLTYDDLRNGDFEELAHFGKIATPIQRERWIQQEGGVKVDEERMKEFAMNQIDRQQGVMQKNVTADDVRQIIKQEVSTSKEEEDIPEKQKPLAQKKARPKSNKQQQQKE